MFELIDCLPACDRACRTAADYAGSTRGTHCQKRPEHQGPMTTANYCRRAERKTTLKARAPLRRHRGVTNLGRPRKARFCGRPNKLKELEKTTEEPLGQVSPACMNG